VGLKVGNSELSEADRRTLWEQFSEVHAKSQESYDSSVRTFAAGGIGITVSLATALHALAGTGLAAISLFLASLTFTFISYVSAQFDMRARVASLRAHRLEGAELEGAEGNGWTRTTTALNWMAGAALIAGAILLAIFVSAHA
jgi:hypothetical protein